MDDKHQESFARKKNSVIEVEMFIRLNLLLILLKHMYINIYIYTVDLMGEVAEDFRAIDVTNTVGIMAFFL